MAATGAYRGTFPGQTGCAMELRRERQGQRANDSEIEKRRPLFRKGAHPTAEERISMGKRLLRPKRRCRMAISGRGRTRSPASDTALRSDT
jgi:hypothetical protein